MKIFSSAFGAKYSFFFPAPSAQNAQNFLWRLRRQNFKIFFGAFGAKVSKFSPAFSAPTFQNFLWRFRRKITTYAPRARPPWNRTGRRPSCTTISQATSALCAGPPLGISLVGSPPAVGIVWPPLLCLPARLWDQVWSPLWSLPAPSWLRRSCHYMAKPSTNSRPVIGRCFGALLWGPRRLASAVPLRFLPDMPSLCE